MILLSDFSSFLEIVAGIYTSMCLNDVLKGIWNTKYYSNLTSALEQFKIKEHEGVINKIIDNNKKVAEGIKWFMQRRAALMLTIDIILLLLCGFESRFASEGDNATPHLKYVQFYMLVLSTLSFISLLFNKFLFSSNRKTAAIIIIILLISSILLFLNIHFDIIWFTGYFVYAILAFLSAPILWQLFACWAYSNAYSGYIKKKVGKVRSQYDAVKRGIRSKDISLVPQEYMQLFTKKNLDQSGASLNQCLGDYLDILEERLIADSKPSSAVTIFISWIKYKASLLIDFFLILFRKKEKLKKQQIVAETAKKKEVKMIDARKLDYSRQLSEYQNEKRLFKKEHTGEPPTMKVFCERHGYNYEEMIVWVRFINKSNNRRNKK